MRNRGTQQMFSSGTSIEDSLTSDHSLCNPRGLVRGHPARCPRLDTCSFRDLSTAKASGGQGGFSPLHPLTRVPLDPVLSSAS